MTWVATSFDNFDNIFFTSSLKYIVWMMSLGSYHVTYGLWLIVGECTVAPATLYIYLSIYIYISMYLCIDISIYLCVSIYIYIYIYLYVFSFIAFNYGVLQIILPSKNFRPRKFLVPKTILGIGPSFRPLAPKSLVRVDGYPTALSLDWFLCLVESSHILLGFLWGTPCCSSLLAEE